MTDILQRVKKLMGGDEREEPKRSFSASDAIAPSAVLGASGLAYAGSRSIDRRLTEAGLADMRGVRARDIPRMLKTTFMRSPEQAVANYADTASKFLSREIGRDASGNSVRGIDLLKVVGKAIKGVGDDMRRLGPLARPVSRLLRRSGMIYEKDFRHPHFNGFPTPGAGVRTLIGEKANWGGLSVNNMGHLIRESLAENGWSASPAAARSFRRKFNNLWRQAYRGETVIPGSGTEDIRQILASVSENFRPGASAEDIGRFIAPGSDIDKSLYDAVKGSFTRKGGAMGEAARIARSGAGKLALLAASNTARGGAITHGGEMALLSLLKAVRSRKFRAGVGIAGATGAAALIYDKIKGKGKKTP